MSFHKDFATPEMVNTLMKDLVKKVKPQVADQVKERNAIREKHQSMVASIARLNDHQEQLKQELSELRVQGATRIQDNKDALAISVKINAREAAFRENKGWLNEFQPQADTLEKDLAFANKVLAETLVDTIAPSQKGVTDEMNELLHKASQLRASWVKAVKQTIDQVGDLEYLHLKAGVCDLSHRLKVDWEKSVFSCLGG